MPGLKGFSHYPCLRKIGHIVEEGAQTKLFGNKEQTQAPSLAALLSFIEQTEYDDMDSLKIDYRVLPRRLITTTANDCLRRGVLISVLHALVHGSGAGAPRRPISWSPTIVCCSAIS